MEITLHFFIACVMGAFVLGYLLAEWYFDSILEKTDTNLAECATEIEDLVAKNDAVTSQLHQYQAIFGEDAVTTYNEMAAENRRLLTKLNQLEVATGRSRSW